MIYKKSRKNKEILESNFVLTWGRNRVLLKDSARSYTLYLVLYFIHLKT